MKRRLPVAACAAILAFGLFAIAQDPPTIDLYGDVLKPQREFSLRTSAGSTPVVKAFTLYDDEAWNEMTNASDWGGSFYYWPTNADASTWVEVPFSSVSSNYIVYSFAVEDTATSGTFNAAYTITNTSGKVYRWANGSVILDYVPPLLYGGASLDLVIGNQALWMTNGAAYVYPKDSVAGISFTNVNGLLPMGSDLDFNNHSPTNMATNSLHFVDGSKIAVDGTRPYYYPQSGPRLDMGPDEVVSNMVVSISNRVDDLELITNLIAWLDGRYDFTGNARVTTNLYVGESSADIQFYSHGAQRMIVGQGADLWIGVGSHSNSLQFYIPSGSVGVKCAASDPNYDFDVNGNGRFQTNLTVTGNVGIGTTPSATYELYVAGYGYFSSGTRANSGYGYMTIDGLTAIRGDGSDSFIGTKDIFVKGSTHGDVGIHTDTPTEALHVEGNILATTNITATADVIAGQNVWSGGGSGQYGKLSYNQMRIYASSASLVLDDYSTGKAAWTFLSDDDDLSIYSDEWAGAMVFNGATYTIAILGNVSVNGTNIMSLLEQNKNNLTWIQEAITNERVHNSDTHTLERPDGAVFGTYSNSLESDMVIEIPLNPGRYSSAWTDYELKIFMVTNSTEEWVDDVMVYFYTSIGDPWDDPPSKGDTNAFVYFVDDQNAFPAETRGLMKWSRYENDSPLVINAQSIAGQLVAANSYIDHVMHYPSKAGCQYDWEKWYWKNNAHRLRAAFIRYDSIGYETNALGDQRWQPVRIDWTPKRKLEDP